MNISSRIAYLILLLLAMLTVPAVHAQDTSNQILYTVSEENGDNTVYTVNVDDGTKTQIGVIHNLYDAGWSPDGKYIYLLDYKAEFGIRVTLLDVDTNRRKTLPDPLNDIICWLPISWSPDSQWLAYTAAPNPNPLRKIYKVSTGETQILPNADTADDLIFWSPDSRYFTYKIISKAQTYKMGVWDVRNQRTALVIDVNVNDNRFPEWSPTESRIVFRDVDSNTVIIYNLSDGKKQEYHNAQFGSWSPDGRFLTIYHKDSPIFQIIDFLTYKPVEFGSKTDVVSNHIWFNWSPDSRYLVTSIPDKDNPDNSTFQILDMLKSTIQTTKMNVPNYDQLSWSPQGNRFAFTSNLEFLDDGALYTSLWLYDVDSQQSYHYATKITTYYGYGFWQPLEWSATGLYMTVQADSGLVLLDWTTKQLKPIRINGQEVGQPRWSPDGTKIALHSGYWDTGDLYVFNPADKTFKNLTHTPDEGETFLGWRGDKYGDSLIGPCGET